MTPSSGTASSSAHFPNRLARTSPPSELPRRAGLLDLPVSELMTTGMLTATLDDDVAAVLNTMTARHFRHLPVVEDGQLLGMVTLADLVRAQLDHLEGAVETLTIQLMDK